MVGKGLVGPVELVVGREKVPHLGLLRKQRGADRAWSSSSLIAGRHGPLDMLDWLASDSPHKRRPSPVRGEPRTAHCDRAG